MNAFFFVFPFRVAVPFIWPWMFVFVCRWRLIVRSYLREASRGRRVHISRLALPASAVPEHAWLDQIHADVVDLASRKRLVVACVEVLDGIVELLAYGSKELARAQVDIGHVSVQLAIHHEGDDVHVQVVHVVTELKDTSVAANLHSSAITHLVHHVFAARLVVPGGSDDVDLRQRDPVQIEDCALEKRRPNAVALAGIEKVVRQVQVVRVGGRVFLRMHRKLLIDLPDMCHQIIHLLYRSRDDGGIAVACVRESMSFHGGLVPSRKPALYASTAPPEQVSVYYLVVEICGVRSQSALHMVAKAGLIQGEQILPPRRLRLRLSRTHDHKPPDAHLDVANVDAEVVELYLRLRESVEMIVVRCREEAAGLFISNLAVLAVDSPSRVGSTDRHCNEGVVRTCKQRNLHIQAVHQ